LHLADARSLVAAVLLAASCDKPTTSTAAPDDGTATEDGMVAISTAAENGQPGPTFWFDAYEVRVEQYAECVAAGACRARSTALSNGKERNTWQACSADPENERNRELPMDCVDYDDAAAYCAWAGKRVPTENDWAWVADCAAKADRAMPRTYTGPVGGKVEPPFTNCLHDLPGNRWEWTSTMRGKHRIVRGGNRYLYDPEYTFASDRIRLRPSQRSFTVGFRCASDHGS
jgi:formylglycine-generating enzyme required for sulfatase activity